MRSEVKERRVWMEGTQPHRCALQSLSKIKEKSKKMIAKPPPLPTPTTQAQKKKIPKRALQEITNINIVSEGQKKVKNENKTNTEEGQDTTGITEFKVLISNYLLNALENGYENDKNESSIITEVTNHVASLPFAREVFGSLGTIKFASDFLERRTITSQQDFMSWLISRVSHRSILDKIQFEKGDIIMSSTEITMRIWYTRLMPRRERANRAGAEVEIDRENRSPLRERKYPRRSSTHS
jgi:hypothetical protein